MPRRLGQHFLNNKSILKNIADTLEINSGDLVIEIGPGHGELTRFLIDKGAVVFAIEKDKELVTKIKSSDIREKIKLIEGDALQVIPEIVNASPLSTSDYKIIGNIPYYITGHLLRIIGDLKNKPSKTVLLIQKEVAERICAKAPHSNLLSLSVAFWAEPKIIGHVSAKDFSPPPEVESAILSISTLNKSDIKKIDTDKYYEFVRKAFKQPRKTLINNLVSAGWEKERAVRMIKSLGLKMDSRPQELSVGAIKQALLCADNFFVV